MSAHPLPSMTMLPHIRDTADGWVVVIGDREVSSPLSEDEASRVLDSLLHG